MIRRERLDVRLYVARQAVSDRSFPVSQRLTRQACKETKKKARSKGRKGEQGGPGRTRVELGLIMISLDIAL